LNLLAVIPETVNVSPAELKVSEPALPQAIS
jgi:hypothetical protein